jgi:hypothetical protein
MSKPVSHEDAVAMIAERAVDPPAKDLYKTSLRTALWTEGHRLWTRLLAPISPVTWMCRPTSSRSSDFSVAVRER